MNLNKRLVSLGIIMLIITWVGNIIYYKEHVLNEPIFLKHYYDVRQGMQTIQLYYLDNIGSKDKAIVITFPELKTSRPIEINEADWNSDHRYYQMKRLDITFYRGDPKEIPKEYRNKLITKAQILFSSGKITTVDIGKIYLYSDEPAKEVIKMSMASASSDNSTKTSFQIDKDLTASGITCRFPELINEVIKAEINGMPVSEIAFPIKLNRGDSIEFAAKYEFNKMDIRRNYIYNFPIDLLTRDKEGKESYAPVYINYWLQSPEQFDIKALLKERSVGKHV